LGQSREITPELGAYVASRAGAKWSSVGEISAGKDGFNVLLDFIPAKSNLVAYRYQNQAKPDAMAPHYYEAVNQFLRYLVARPLPKQTGAVPDQALLKQLAEALDREYGWFVTAEPGKAEALVAQLAQTDTKLARLLFNPVLYPILGAPPPKPKSPEIKPLIPAPSPKPSPEAAARAVDTPAKQPDNPPPEKIAADGGGQPAPQPAEKVPEAPAPTASPPAETSVEASEPPKVDESINAVPFVPIPRPRSESRPPEAAQFQPVLIHPLSNPASPRKGEQALPAIDPEPVPASTADPNPTSVPYPYAPETRGFKVQVFASKSFEETDSRARTFEKLGFKSEIVDVDLNEKGIWYRLRLVGFPSRQEARKAAEKLKAEKVISQFWIVP